MFKRYQLKIPLSRPSRAVRGAEGSQCEWLPS